MTAHHRANSASIDTVDNFTGIALSEYISNIEYAEELGAGIKESPAQQFTTHDRSKTELWENVSNNAASSIYESNNAALPEIAGFGFKIEANDHVIDIQTHAANDIILPHQSIYYSSTDTDVAKTPENIAALSIYEDNQDQAPAEEAFGFTEQPVHSYSTINKTSTEIEPPMRDSEFDGVERETLVTEELTLTSVTRVDSERIITDKDTPFAEGETDTDIVNEPNGVSTHGRNESLAGANQAIIPESEPAESHDMYKLEPYTSSSSEQQATDNGNAQSLHLGDEYNSPSSNHQPYNPTESWPDQAEEQIVGFDEVHPTSSASYSNEIIQEDIEVVMFIRATDDL